MKPLLILIVISLIALFALKAINGLFAFSLSARIGLSAMLLFAAMGHFMFTDGMAMMVPDIIPFKKELIYFTGIIEIVGAIGLHISGIRILTGWLLIAFFILILPANIKASMEHINFQKGNYNGDGIMYLWFRIPLQILFIVWTYVSSIRFH